MDCFLFACARHFGVCSHPGYLAGWVSAGVQDSFKVKRMETGDGDWLLCPLTSLWGKVGEGPEETQWRHKQADRQFSGSLEQISRPYTHQTEGSLLLTYENSTSTEPRHLEWPC